MNIFCTFLFPQLPLYPSAASCTVTVTVGDVAKSVSGAYNYVSSLKSTVTSVKPLRGGTGGGTSVTITGTNLGWGLGYNRNDSWLVFSNFDFICGYLIQLL